MRFQALTQRRPVGTHLALPGLLDTVHNNSVDSALLKSCCLHSRPNAHWSIDGRTDDNAPYEVYYVVLKKYYCRCCYISYIGMGFVYRDPVIFFARLFCFVFILVEQRY